MKTKGTRKSNKKQIGERPRETLLNRWTERLANGEAPMVFVMTSRTRSLQVARGNKRAIKISAV